MAIMQKQNAPDELQMLAMPQPFMTVMKNDRHSRVEVHLRGEFKSPQESSQQLTELYQLAEQYPICLVYINSPGGRVDTLMEIVNILKKFDSTITVVTSDAASAGFMLWSTGDVRVVCPNAEMMVHRETSGYADKTDGFFERASFLKRRFESLFQELCGGVLDPAEIDRARNGEVWLLGQDMIDRGAAISWDQFHIMDTTPVEPLTLFPRGDEYYVDMGGILFKADIEINQEEAYDLLDVMYDMPDKTNLLAGLNDEEEGDEEPEEADERTYFNSEEELRNVLRSKFGKGNYRITFDSTIDGKIDGTWVEVFAPPAHSANLLSFRVEILDALDSI